MRSATVIISQLNSERTIARCLESVKRQDYPKELVRYIVVDGGSTDGTPSLLEQQKDERMRVLCLPGASEAQGHMEALKLVETDAVLFTNSDCYVGPGWIRMHMAQLKRYPLVGGRLFWAGDIYTQTWNFAKPFDKGHGIMWRLVHGIQKRGYGLGFSNAAVRTSVLREIGLADVHGHQDTIFAFESVKKGYDLKMDNSNLVTHDHPFRSVKGSFHRSLGYSRNHVIVYRFTFGGYLRPKDKAAKRLSLAVSLGFISEATCVAGVRAWQEWRSSIDVSLLRFLAVRWFGFFCGSMVGVVKGVLCPRPSYSSISNLHTRRVR